MQCTIGDIDGHASVGSEAGSVFRQEIPSVTDSSGELNETTMTALGIEIPIYFPGLLISTLHFPIDVTVQGTSFKWKGYDITENKLRAIPSDVEIFEGHISEQLLGELIGRCDALILPYDAISYSMAASAVVYQSSNLLVPVLVSEGTGFAQECKDFGIG